MFCNPEKPQKKRSTAKKNLKHMIFRVFIFAFIAVLTFTLWRCGSPIDTSINNQKQTAIVLPKPTDTTTIINTPSPTQTSTEIIKLTETVFPSQTPITKTESPTVNPSETGLAPPTPTSIKIPKYSSDLLYMSNNNLLLWDHVTNESSLVSNNVHDYSINSNGTLAAILMSKNIVANGVQLYDLGIVDIRLQQSIPILKSIPKIYNLSLSPDNKWIIYTSNYNGGRITAIETSGEQTTINLGFCHQLLNTPCDNISWSADSEQVIWSDQRGVWINELFGENPRLITQNQAPIDGPGGETTQIEVNYTDFSWSPSGRYVLASVNPTTYLTNWSVIIDSRRMKIIGIPQSLQISGHSSNTAWLQDGSILVGSGIEQAGEESYPVTIQIFEIVPTQENLLQLINTFGISDDQLPAPVTNADDIQYMVDWIYQYNENKINFGVYIPEGRTTITLYSLIRDKYFFDLIRYTPTTTSQILWAPDESGKIIIDSDGSIYFASMDGESFFQLNQILGSDLNNFTWLPPAPRD